MGYCFEVFAIDMAEVWKLFGCKDSKKLDEIWKWANVKEGWNNTPRYKLSHKVSVKKRELRTVMFADSLEGATNTNITAVFYLLVKFVGHRLPNSCCCDLHASCEETTAELLQARGFPEKFCLEPYGIIPPPHIIALKESIEDDLQEGAYIYQAVGGIDAAVLISSYEIEKDNILSYKELKEKTMKEIEEEWATRKKDGTLPPPKGESEDNESEGGEEKEEPSKKKRKVEKEEEDKADEEIPFLEKAKQLYPDTSPLYLEDAYVFRRLVGSPYHGDYEPRHHLQMMTEKTDWWLGSMAGEMCSWLHKIEILEQKDSWKAARAQLPLAENDHSGDDDETADVTIEGPLLLSLPPELIETEILKYLDLISLRSFGCVSKATSKIASKPLKEWDAPLQGKYSIIMFLQ